VRREGQPVVSSVRLVEPSSELRPGSGQLLVRDLECGITTVGVVHRRDQAARDEPVDQLADRLAHTGWRIVEQLATEAPAAGTAGADEREQDAAHEVDLVGRELRHQVLCLLCEGDGRARILTGCDRVGIEERREPAHHHLGGRPDCRIDREAVAHQLGPWRRRQIRELERLRRERDV